MVASPGSQSTECLAAVLEVVHLLPSPVVFSFSDFSPPG